MTPSASRAMRDPLPKLKGRRRKIGGVQESDLDTIRERRMGEQQIPESVTRQLKDLEVPT